MKFIDYIEPKIIDLNYPFSSKKRVFEYLANKLGDNDKEVSSIYDCLVQREKIGVTSLANGAAIPHGQCLTEKEVRIHMLVLNKAVDYESVDDVKVQLIICVIFPRDPDDSHKKLLKHIGAVFKKHRVYRQIIAAESAQQVKQILLEESV